MTRKGFTLIELLAVIVILAIIALIATPIVLDIIEDSKLSAAKLSVNNYIKAINTTLLSNSIYGEENIKHICYIVLKNNNSYMECDYLEDPLLIDIKGDKPTGGIIEVVKNKVVEYEVDIFDKTIYSTAPTPSKCFETSENEDGTLTITKYLCGNNDEMKILDVIIPKRINKKLITEIGSQAFEKSRITSVQMPVNIKKIGFAAFRYNKMNSVVIPDSIETINVSTFQSCGLSSVVFSKNLKYIGASAFENNNLTEVVIPEGVGGLGTKAFKNNNLTKVVIPTSLASLNSGVFSSNELISVTIKGKNSLMEFTNYPNESPFGWTEGYSDENIIFEP